MRLFTPLLLCLCLATTGHAAEWGVLPLPRESSKWVIEDYVAALKMVKDINAPIQVSVNSWSELEPSTGKFATDQHLGGLAYGHDTIGLIPYFGVSLINTVKRDMPRDLLETPWDDPALLPRFEALIKATREKLPADLGFFVIGNEVDVYFEKNPAELGPYLSFYHQAHAIVRRYYPQARIGITVTYEGLIKGRSEIIRQVVAASDAAFFTLYPIIDLKPETTDSINGHLDRLTAAAQGKDIYLQEVGFPSASGLGSSEQMQAEVFATMIPAIEARPQIKLASIFLLHDLDPKLCRGLVGYYGFTEAPTALATALYDFLCSLGVRRLDGSAKPAWDVVAQLLSTRHPGSPP